jgi:hypothetical protein
VRAIARRLASARVAVVTIVALATAVALALAGCSDAPAGPLLLSWQFADQRDCFSTGATAIEARTRRALDAMPLGSFRCSLGVPPASVTLDPVPGSGTLYVDALSAGGVDLYHGQLALASLPPGTGEVRTVTLFAVAAQ